YAPHELEIDVARLGRRAGARVVLAPAIGIDPVSRRITAQDSAPVPYDVASLDVGSTVRGLDLPGVRDHALATRPIRDYVDRLAAAVAASVARCGGAMRLVVVGAGAAGVELAFTLRARVRGGGAPHVTVLSAEPTILPGDAPRAAARIRREAERRG